jgi:MFS family permease
LWIKIGEYWSRKRIVVLGSTIQIAAYAGLLFLSFTLSLMYFYYFLLGLGSVLSICTSYNYLNELTPNHSKIAVSTLYISFQTLPAILMPGFLGLLNENVFPFLYFGFGLSLTGLFLTLTSVPESPHYNFAMGRFLECQAALNYIARFNGVREGAPNYVDMTQLDRE